MRMVERGITREAMRACPARLACMPRLAACILLSVLLALVPLEAQITRSSVFGRSFGEGALSFQKSQARANPAAVAAGAALSALAVELGISETALMAAIAVSAAGATGLAVNMALDPQAPPAPGFKPWDDLTPEEKGIWGDYNPGTGEGGDIETYQKNAIGWWALQYGLLETGDNGGFEPSSEPDPEQDPDGHSKWVKARNAIIALGAGGAAVAFNDAVSPLIDNASAEVRALLFGRTSGSSEYNLGLMYKQTLFVSGYENYPVITGVIPLSVDRDLSGIIYHYDTQDWITYAYASASDANPYIRVYRYNNPVIFDMKPKGSSGNYYWQSQSLNDVWFINNENTFVGGGGSAATTTYGSMLNALYKGTYSFPNGAKIENGVPSGFGSSQIEYGQMPTTPEQLQQVITQPNQEIQNFYNTYTDAGDGNKRAISIPSGFGSSNTPLTYPDMVVNIPDSTPDIPDDVVYPGTGYNPNETPNPNPDPNPNPNPDPVKPNPDFDYPDSIGEAIDNLGNAVFDQLFPFCLIGDIRRLCEKFNPAPQNVRMLSVASDEPSDASQYSFVLPLSDFNIDGVDDISFEIGPLFVVGNMVRPWWTVLFAAGLIAESVRYFLK